MQQNVEKPARGAESQFQPGKHSSVPYHCEIENKMLMHPERPPCPNPALEQTWPAVRPSRRSCVYSSPYRWWWVPVIQSGWEVERQTSNHNWRWFWHRTSRCSTLCNGRSIKSHRLFTRRREGCPGNQKKGPRIWKRVPLFGDWHSQEGKLSEGYWCCASILKRNWHTGQQCCLSKHDWRYQRSGWVSPSAICHNPEVDIWLLQI